MRNLKQILKYNKVFIISGFLLILYIIFITKIVTFTSSYNINESSIIGKITSIKLDGDKLTLGVSAKEDIIATYYLSSENEKNKIFNILHLGDKVLLRGSLNEPLKSSIPNTFDYKNYLYNKKIYYTFTISDYKVISSNNFLYKIKDSLFKKMYSMDNGDYFLALIIGDKTLLSSDIFNSYQNNGISHLLAVSGMHINTLVLMISLFIKNKKKEFIITSLFLLFYLFITGLSPSIMRAIIFYILMKINTFKNLKFSNMHILFFTAFIILFLDPFMLYDLGFIYSFVVCFGIIYYQDYLQGNYFMKLLKLSYICFLFSLPITALVNYEINILSVFINLIFIPWISLFIFPFSIIAFILPFLNPILSFFIDITNRLNFFLENISIFINIPKMPYIFVVLAYLVLLLKIKRKALYLSLIIIICKIIPYLDSNYYIYYLDVGQGDCALLTLPYKSKAILIDTGGKIDYPKKKWQERKKVYNLSDNTIKFLKSKGITNIDYLIITHGDMDHMGEALNIVDKLDVDKVIFNCGSLKDIENNLINVLNKKNIKYYTCINNINLGNINLNFLNTKTSLDENTNSSVIYFNINNYKFLFMGDASIEREENILKKYNLKDIDFLKVGHHGSNTSSSKEFIDSINPKYSIISVGKNNRYGHPKKEVLDILSGSRIYRTDINGSIEVKLNKNSYKIKTCNGI